VTPFTPRRADATETRIGPEPASRRDPRARAVRAAAAVAAGALALAAVHPALAHVVKPFGPYSVALGWVHEPAYIGFDNAVQVIVKDAKGTPFTGITDKDLTVEVSFGSQRMDAQPLVPTADPDTGLGIPGEYEMHFIPTAPGAYTFHIHGAINGTPVDETATSSDTTFDEVKSDSDVEFPAKVPSTSDLATRLDRVSARVDSLQRSQPPDALPVALVALFAAFILGGAGVIIGLGARRRGAL
jgi:hypothetical protein